MDTPSLTPFLLFLVGSRLNMYAALLCTCKNILFGSGKTKIFSLLNSEIQKTKNGRLSRAVRSVEFQKLTYEKKNEKQITILYYLLI